MTGMQLPAIIGATTARMPDAVYAPARGGMVPTERRSEWASSLGVDPYRRGRTPVAGLLVDYYG